MQRILIVDDEPLLCELLAETLSAEGYEVATAEDGRGANRLLAEIIPDLLITDIFMPAVDGLETIKEIREKLPTTKIIAISGGSPIREMDVFKWAKVWGADHVFKKPIDQKDLLAAVKDCLESANQRSL